MKRIDLVKIHRELLKFMSVNDIKISDVKFLDIYDEFTELRKHEKYAVALMELSKKFNIGERTISRSLSRLQAELYPFKNCVKNRHPKKN